MSYDVFLRCVHCMTDNRLDLPGPTYNLTPIFDYALTGEEMPNPGTSEFEAVVLHKETDRPRGLRVLDGKKAKDTQEMLLQAIHRLTDPALHARFTELEPPNKWGTLDDATQCMLKYKEAALAHPDLVWVIR